MTANPNERVSIQFEEYERLQADAERFRKICRLLDGGPRSIFNITIEDNKLTMGEWPVAYDADQLRAMLDSETTAREIG